MDLAPKVLQLLVSGFLTLLLAGFVFWKYRKRRIARVLSLCAFAYAGYSWFLAGLAASPNAASANIWYQYLMPSAYLLVASVYHFCLVFSNSKNKFAKAYLRISYFVVLMLSIARIFELDGGGMVYREGQGWFPDQNIFYRAVYIPFVLANMLGGLSLVVIRMIQAKSGVERNKFWLFFVAIVAALLLDATNLSSHLDFLAAFSPVAFTGILIYAISRHRLFDLSLVLKKGPLVAGLSFSIVVALVAAVLKVLDLVVIGEMGFGAASLGSSALLIAILFPFMWSQVFGFMNRLFDVRVMSLEQRLLEYTSLLDKYLRPDEYLSAILNKLGEDMGISKSWMLVKDRVKGGFLSGASNPPDFDNLLILGPESPLVLELQRSARPLDLEELLSAFDDDLIDGLNGESRNALTEELRIMGAEVALPVQLETRLEGILLLSSKASDAIYTARELEFLQALCVQLARALENSQLHVQVQQADRLSTLGILSASLAHELRNPLTSISTFVQMMPTRYADEGFREKFSRIVGMEMSKLIKLTEQLLSFSKPSVGKNSAMNLVSLCDRVRQLLRYQFSKKGVDLSLEIVQGAEGSVMGKESELSQVFINLLLNALQATDAGGSVAMKVWDDAKNSYASVTDSGIGMTPEQLKHIFDPFYTTKEDGTGLGLPTCLRVVEQHQGSLTVNSSPGQGASFVMRLPLKQSAASLQAA